jgi:hypothetical protein
MQKVTNHVEHLALEWAAHDPLETWILAAPDSQTVTPEALCDVVGSYLAAHDPYPDGTRVDVQQSAGEGWDSAVIIGRTSTDEWTVQYGDGSQAWRDHSELRPAR